MKITSTSTSTSASTPRRIARVRTLLIGSTAALLGACGGGGGSGGITPVPLASAPGDAAISGFYTSAHDGTLSATAPSGPVTFHYVLAPTAGTSTFEGTTVVGVSQTVTLTTSTGAQTSDITTEYFTTSPFHLYGLVSSTTRAYTVYGGFTALPATVSVGQSGQLGTGIAYQDSTKAVIDHTVANSWSAQADSATTILLCLTSVDTPAVGGDATTETDCFRVNAAGTATLASVTVTQGSNSLKFQ